MTWPNSLYPVGGAMGEEIEEPRIIETAVDSSSLKITIIWVHVRVHNMRKGFLCGKIKLWDPKLTILLKKLTLDQKDHQKWSSQFKNCRSLTKTAISWPKMANFSAKISILSRKMTFWNTK